MVTDKAVSNIDNLDLELYTLLVKMTDQVEEVRKIFYSKFGLTPIQHRILCFIALSQHKRLTFSELSDLLGVTRPNVTALIDRMEAKGLIKRIMNEKDRRSMNVVLTEEAVKLFQKMGVKNNAFDASLFSCLTAEEKETLYHLVLKIRQKMLDYYGVK